MHIAIVGGGIGGLTTALALQQTGLEVSIFEQATQLQSVGAGLQLSPNAVRLLQRLGLNIPLRSVAVRPTATEQRRWQDNRILFRSPLGDESERAFGAPHYSIHRGDLQRVLCGAISARRVHLGRCCLAVKPHSDGVDLTFTDGSSIRADVVIGADGIHSVVREALFSDQFRFSSLSAYRGLIPAQRLPFLLEELRVINWWGPGKHFVCYPVSRAQFINFVAVVPAGDWRSESWSVPGRIEDVQAAFSGWNEQVTKIISAADKTSRWALYDRDPFVRWSDQRITLLGDAAHPMLPFFAQGASQSIEDAWILAGCLKDATDNTVAAELHRYETLRKPRTSRLQLQSRRMGDMYHLPDGEAQQQRDNQLAAHNGPSLAWLYGYDAECALHNVG